MKARIFLVLTILLFLKSGNVLSQAFELTNTKDVYEYYTSGGYDEEINGIIWQAKEYFSLLEVKEMSTVVFDIDETALSNFEFDTIHVPYSSERWNEWVKSGKAVALKPVKELYDYLVSRDFHIIFITGRTSDYFDVTKANLVNVGYNVFDTLICRDPREIKLTAAEYKTRRRQELVDNGYSIVGNVGDQWSDMSGGNSGYFVRITNYIYYVE